MANNIQRNRGRSTGYKFDRGAMPTEFGPYIGEVMDNVDNTRSGRLRVYIEQFAGADKSNESLWIPVDYAPPFYGMVQQSGTAQGVGSYVGNPQSYGMWFTPPDLGTMVLCFFVQGDPNQGYYVACIPDIGINHMIPAVGASKKYVVDNAAQQTYFAGASQLPVTEINDANNSITNNPRFFDQPKPVHSYVAATMLQQGLIKDTVRGPITSNSQRESPSAVFGISTPGRAIYQGGYTEADIKAEISDNQLTQANLKVIGRRGGHSIVLDDGNIEGKDNLIRIRTSAGHQITMSDDGNCFYITHANGQTWIELGGEGTVDVFATNSVNVRSQGEINLHADKTINMYAGESINIKSTNVELNGNKGIAIVAEDQLALYSKKDIDIISDKTLTLDSNYGGWAGGAALAFKALRIDLNGFGPASTTQKPRMLSDLQLPDTKWVTGKGWESQPGTLKTIVSRAPTHEPYAYHNRGVAVDVSYGSGQADNIPLNDGLTRAAASLVDKVVQEPINIAELLKQGPSNVNIANLTSQQVDAMMTSAAKEVGQSFAVATVAKGIGKFGFNPRQLEQLGFIKPGTVDQFIKNPAQALQVLQSPTVWTGKENVTSLSNVLSSESLQNSIQTGLMTYGAGLLQKSGILKNNTVASVAATAIQTAAKYGVETATQWATGQVAGAIINKVIGTNKNVQFAVNLASQLGVFQSLGIPGLGGFGGGASSLFGGFGRGRNVIIPGKTNTIQRIAVDAAIRSVIGNAKVPLPRYTAAALSGLARRSLLNSSLISNSNIGFDLDRNGSVTVENAPYVQDESGE